MTISQLDKLFPDKPKRYIYKGKLLDENFTFEQYDISSGAHLFALFDDDESNNWIQLSCDADYFHERAMLSLTQDAKLESYKIRDLQLTKLESRPRSYNKYCKGCLDKKGFFRYDMLDSQSFSPLFCSDSFPIFW